MPVESARIVCNAVTMKDLHNNCVFDVATTGDEVFTKGHLLAQDLRLNGTSVEIACGEGPCKLDQSPGEPPSQPDRSLVVTATVLPLTPGRPIPTGSVTFFVDGVPLNRPVQLDEQGRARVTVPRLKPGEHKCRAAYSGGGKYDYHSSSNPNLIHTVGRPNQNGDPEPRPAPMPMAMPMKAAKTAAKKKAARKTARKTTKPKAKSK